MDQVHELGGVVNDVLRGKPILVLYDASSQSGLAYSRSVNGQVLDFYNASTVGLELRDRNTDSLWELQGRSTEGSLSGAALEFVPSFISEWYGWSGYHPETDIFEPAS